MSTFFPHDGGDRGGLAFYFKNLDAPRLELRLCYRNLTKNQRKKSQSKE